MNIKSLSFKQSCYFEINYYQGKANEVAHTLLHYLQ